MTLPSLSTQHAAWHDELARVMASKCFAGATRIRDLLSFLVKEMIEGRGERIKEYLIGVEVLGRGPDFDPRVDTNVRTEAWRLRARLERYYASEGAGNPVRIELPRRTFVPVLVPRPVAEPVQAETSSTIAICGTPLPLGVLVEPFDDSASMALPDIGRMLTDELQLELGDHPGLRLHAGGQGGLAEDASLLLRGAVRPGGAGGNALRTLVQLVRREDGLLLWSHGLEHLAAEGFELPRRMAQDVARALMSSPLAKSTDLNRPFAPARMRAGFVRRILSSGFEGLPVDLEAVQRETRRIECWLQHHPHDLDAYRRLATLLCWCVCAAPSSSPNFAPLLRRCGRELMLQPGGSVDALVELGLAAMVDFDWQGALELLDAAIREQPDCSDARVVRGLCALHLGEIASAQDDLETACRVDANSALAFATLGLFHFHQHRFPQAAVAARHALRLDGRCEPAAVLLADSELCGGETQEGIGLLQRARSWSGRRPVILGRLGHTYAVTGREHLARELLSQLQSQSGLGMPAYAAIADIYLGLGDADAAFVQLGHAVHQRVLPDLLLLRSAPRYDGLRQDSRFCQLIEHMALPAAA